MPARRGHGDLAPAQPGAGPHDHLRRAMIRPAPVHGVTGGQSSRCRAYRHGAVCAARRLLIGHHAVGPCGQYRAGHDFHTRIRRWPERALHHPGGLHALTAKRPRACRQRRRAQRVTVHRHPVERRQIPVGAYIPAQHSTVGGRERAVLAVKEGKIFADQPLGSARREHGGGAFFPGKGAGGERKLRKFRAPRLPYAGLRHLPCGAALRQRLPTA